MSSLGWVARPTAGAGLAEKAAKRTVAILGGGPGGLVAAKEMLAAGLQPTLFDRATSIGGMWGRDAPQFWRTNLSHLTCRFSDFPWDPESPMFPSQKQVGSYLGRYSQAFIPPECFRLGNEVTLVSRSAPGPGAPDAQRQWEVQWRAAAAAGSAAPHGVASASFDHVVVASGFFGQPHLPQLPNQAAFLGEVLHSSSYRDGARLAGKRVAVVGGGHSAVEIAADLASHGADVTHVAPRPLWVIPRLLPLDAASPASPFLPLDLALYRRSRRRTQQEQLLRTAEDNRKVQQALSAMLTEGSLVPSPLPPAWPLERVLDAPPQFCISDTYTGAYRCGKIAVVLGRVEEMRESSLLVRAGSDGAAPGPLDGVDALDAVVLCTGFKPSLGFLEPELLEQLGYDAADVFSPLLLHRNVFHPAAPGLALVGMYRAPYFGVMELQAKWAAAVFSGSLPPPPVHLQQQGLELAAAIRAQRPRPQFPHPDYVGHADALAELLAPVAGSSPGGLSSTAPTAAAATVVSPHSDPAAVAIAEDVVLPGSYHGAATAAAAAAEASHVVAAALRGRGVAAAVFRSLAGPWTLSRSIASALPSSPSGTVSGAASFTPIASTGELLYSEQGTFAINGGQQMRVWRKYVYSYDEAEDRLSVFFAEADGKGLPFMALTLQPAGAGGEAAAESGGVGGAGLVSCPVAAPGGGAGAGEPGPECSGSGGWVATGDHLCGRDMYRAAYRFTFTGAELSEVRQCIRVQGPEKDYTAETRFTRQE